MPRPKTEKEQLGVDPEEDAGLDYDQQPVPEPVAVEEPEADAVEVPEWVPEKFRKDPAKFAESYTNLERELQERGARERQLTERMTQLEEYAQQAQAQPQAQTDDPLAAYAQELEIARESGDIHREVQLQAWLQQYNMQQAFAGFEQRASQQQQPRDSAQNELLAVQANETMMRRYDDWEEKQEKIAELLNRDPDLLPETALSSFQGMTNALDRAYKLVGFEEQAAQLQELHDQGISAADVSRARKLSSQTLSGSSGRPGEPSEADKELAEMRNALHRSSWEHGQSSPTRT